MTNETETTTKKLPSFDIYIVTPRKDKKEDFWQKVSAMWEHPDGNGFNMTVNGQKLVARRRKPKPA